MLAAADPCRCSPRALVDIANGELLGPDRHLHHPSVFARIHESLELFHARPEGNGIGTHQGEPTLLTGFNQGEALLLGVAKRLLHQDMLIAQGEKHTAFVMQIVGQRDQHGIHLVHYFFISRGGRIYADGP